MHGKNDRIAWVRIGEVKNEAERTVPKDDSAPIPNGDSERLTKDDIQAAQGRHLESSFGIVIWNRRRVVIWIKAATVRRFGPL